MQTKRTLLLNHLADLRMSGLTDETIAMAGLYSEQSIPNILALLNRKRYARSCGPALVFPYFDHIGTVVLNRLKPTLAPVIDDKPVKYLAPTGSELRLYVPPAAYAKLSEPPDRNPIFITEGEKKTLRGWQDDFLTIGLAGVTCWHKKKSFRMIADLERIAWKGREVYIVFDSDAAENEQVEVEEAMLAHAIGATHGGKVKIIRLTADAKGCKQGLDDFLVAQGKGAFIRLMRAAVKPKPPNRGAMKMPVKHLDAEDFAKRLVKGDLIDGLPRYRFWNGSFWLWRDGEYKAIDDNEFRALVRSEANKLFNQVTIGAVSNVIDQLKSLCLLSSRVDAPAWISERGPARSGPGGWRPEDVISTPSGLLHLPSLVAETGGYEIPASPRFFTHNSVRVRYSPTCPRPDAWLEFLRSVWGDDAAAIRALQEWFGYCLTGDCSQQKILLVIGPTRSGKGTIARILRQLVGQQNVCSPSLSSLGTAFGLWPMLDRSLAIIPDSRLSRHSDRGAIVESLLKISGQDSVTVHRKFLPTVEGELSVKIMLLSNEIPHLMDASAALARRFLVLHMNRSFYGHEDRHLTAKLTAELPSIFAWAIGGWRSLRNRGHFVQPESGMAIADAFEMATSPIRCFVEECCEVGKEFEVDKHLLYEAYCSWCEGQGMHKTVTLPIFAKMLYEAEPCIAEARPRDEDGRRKRLFHGITLKP